jgi:parallel beta-helix repeat protein
LRSEQTRVERNRVTGNGFYDNGDDFCRICVIDSNDNEVVRNLAGGTSSFGVIVDGSSTGNRLVGNVASTAAQGGILIRADTRQTLLKRNIANENCFKYLGQCYRETDPQDGIRVETPSATLTKNTANDNLDLGIDAVPGVVDGGGNRASGNGNPLQCLNVVCRTDGRGN